MFKHKFFFLLVILILSSCNKKETDKESQAFPMAEELLLSHLEKAKDETQSEELRLQDAKTALSWGLKINDDAKKQKYFSSIAFVLYSLKEYDTYKEINKDILNLSIKNKDSSAIARSYSNLGSYYNVNNIKDSAFYNFFNADKVYDKMKLEDVTEHGIVLYNMAFLQRDFKNYVSSESNTVNAIEKFKLSQSNLYLYYCYNQLGVLSKDLGRFDNAIKNYKSALEYAKKIENGKYREIQALNNIGVVFKELKDYNTAIAYYKEALGYKSILKEEQKFYALLLDNIAYAKFLKGDREQILPMLLKPLEIRESIGDELGLITNNIHLSEYYNDLGQDSISKDYALKSMHLANTIGSQKEMLSSLLLLSKVSDHESGIAYANRYITLNDSIQNQERLSKDKFARIKFETDEIVEENIKMSKENDILIYILLGLTALSLLGYIIFIQRQKNKALLFAQTQQESNEEIYRLLLNQQVKLEEGRQLEQQRMSEELHDGVLGRLFGVRLSLDGINQRANDEFTETRNKYIDELKAIEKEIRLISHDLGAETLPSDVAYIDAVENLIGDLCGIHKINYEFNNDESIDWENVDDYKKVNLFRILQESMQNIFKHAKAEIIKINFEYGDDKINLTILDDGIGFETTKVKKGIGLKNITSRVKQMNGEVKFLSKKDEGATVFVTMPVKAKMPSKKIQKKFSINL